MYRIVDWDKHFENNRSRELKELTWVPFPNSHDGDGYTELLDHPNGAAHFGVWCAVAQVASKCEPRGTLVRDGNRPHDAASLSRMIRIPPKLVADALARFVDPVGWLEIVPDPVSSLEVAQMSQPGATGSQEGAGFSQADAPRVRAMNGREGNGKKGMETICGETAEPSSPLATGGEPAVLEFPCDGNPNAWLLTKSQLAEWSRLFPSLDVEAQSRSALAWVLADSARRKTARGMQKFLVGWFGRAQNRGHDTRSQGHAPRARSIDGI